MIFKAEEHIEATSATVWHTLTNPALMTGWMNGVDSMRSDDGGPLKAGGTLIFTARGRERTSKIIEFQPERAMTLRSTQGPFTATYRYRLASGDDGVRVTLEADCKVRGAALLIKPFINFMIRRVDGGQIRLLRDLIVNTSQP